MKAEDLQTAIQKELTSNGFGNKLANVTEDNELHTVLEFSQPVTTELFQWLNSRFMYGVTMYDQLTIKLNHPNEKA